MTLDMFDQLDLDGDEAFMKRGLFIPLLLVFFALFSPSIPSVSDSANAASTCSLTGQTTPEWGEDAELIETGKVVGGSEGFFSEAFSIGAELDPLTNGFVTSVNVSDDGYTAIRMNMIEGYRYTFCVSFASAPNQTVSGDPLADVYLMENLDYDRYKWDDSFGDSEDQGGPAFFSFFGWIPYRDIHAYENTRNIDFSVTFEDGGSSSSQGIFGNGNDDSMYLVLDARNNSRDNDAPSRGQNMVAQIIIVVEERALLPKTTVYMLCCSLPMMVIIAPIIIHQRYVRGGWDKGEVELELMPMVENNSSTPGAYMDED